MRNPYRVGSWVSAGRDLYNENRLGSDFYNRDRLLQDILAGPTDNLWIIGNRRIGKTSLLRAAEHRAINSTQYLPLFWDMQGDTREAQLIESLLEAIEYAQLRDVDKRWKDIVLPEDASSISQALRSVAAEAKKHHCRLLLLCDETEGLIQLGQQEPRVLSELRRVMQQHPTIRTILTSTRRLSRLYAVQEQQGTSLFLEGFERHFLANFDDPTANQLICQTQSDQPLIVPKQLQAKLRFFSGNHPLILQKMCGQLFDPNTGELGNFNPDEFVVDDQLASTFQQDFDSLTPAEAQILLLVNSQAVALDEIHQAFPNISERSLRSILYNLTNLGLLRRLDGKYYAGSILLGQWLVTAPPHHSAQVGNTNRMIREVSQQRLISLLRQHIAYTRHLGQLKIKQSKQGFEIAEFENYRNKILEIEAELIDLGENFEDYQENLPKLAPFVLVSHSSKDEKEKDRLLTHLDVLQKNAGLFNIWSYDQINAGAEREDAVGQAIAQANVAILLITPDFLASDFILGKTIPSLLKRRKEEGLVIFPVIAKACSWKSVDWLAEMEVRPKNRKPVWSDTGSHVDEDLVSIAEEIKAIVSRGF